MALELFYSQPSPYVRKVRAAAIEIGTELVLIPASASPVARSPDLVAANPLGKLPCLRLADGELLYDSRVICRYLGAESRLYPRGNGEWRALRREALADGLLDAALLARYETFLRPEPLRWQDWLDGQLAKVSAALHTIDKKDGAAKAADGPQLHFIKQLLKNRMMVGIYVAQYCINALTYFFITWFPVYLVQARGMTILKAGFAAVAPAAAGFVGGVLGGIISDWFLRKNFSLSVARKTPIILGMILSMSIIVCNYTDDTTLVIFFMSLAFFGKGIGALGWAVNSDTAPKQIAGLSGGLLNTCGNISSITTPIAIGYIVQGTGSFNGALVYVGVHAFIAALCYLFVVGEIKRVELK